MAGFSTLAMLKLPSLPCPRTFPGTCRFVVFVALSFGAVPVPAAEINVDFESVSPDLPGWNAVAPNANNQPEYRLASKWDAPFRFSLDEDKPHSGSRSLKCDFAGEVPGTFNFGPEVLAAAGAVEVRFFVRTEGFIEEGTVTFGEYEGSKRIPSSWTGTKIPLSEDWQEVIWSGQLKPETNGLRMRIVFKSVPAGAKIWIDDITVKAAEN